MSKFQPPMLNDDVCRAPTDKQTHKDTHTHTHTNIYTTQTHGHKSQNATDVLKFPLPLLF